MSQLRYPWAQKFTFFPYIMAASKPAFATEGEIIFIILDHKQTCTLLHGENHFYLSRLFAIHSLKDCQEQKLSGPLLIRCAEMQETPGRLSSNTKWEEESLKHSLETFHLFKRVLQRLVQGFRHLKTEKKSLLTNFNLRRKIRRKKGESKKKS